VGFWTTTEGPVMPIKKGLTKKLNMGKHYLGILEMLPEMKPFLKH